MTGSNASKKISVFGVTIESNSELCRLLGYSAPIGKTIIFQRYGNYENFIKRRYKIDSDEQAKAKLLELMGQKEDKTIQNTPILETKEQKCAKAYINALINQGNEQILDALCLAFDCQKDDVLQVVESLKNAQ